MLLLADHTLVKASLMRITLHLVHHEDYAGFHAAMVPSLRASRLYDRRFTTSGLSIDDVDARAAQVLAFASEGRSTPGARGHDRLHPRPSGAAGVVGTPNVCTALARADGRPLVVRDQVRVRRGTPGSASETAYAGPIGHLVRRYLEGFGPASVQDVAQFSCSGGPLIREAIDAFGDEVVRMKGPDGSLLFDMPGGVVPPDDVPAPPRLLPMWDSTLLAYANRDRIIPSEYRRLVIRQNGDVLPTLLVDGYVAGVWRQVGDGIEATAFRRWPRTRGGASRTRPGALADFLAGRGSAVYRRYGHWWATLPSAEVRRLAG